MTKLSIIVPVYNCAECLARCVTSILNQTEQNLQIILVDDGSKDNSGKLCDDFAEKDCRVKVIHQKNAGVSAARNAGLDAAVGEYIGFVDADDYIAPDTYETALAACLDCDMAMWDAVTVWADGKQESDTIPMLSENTVLEKKDWSPELLAQMAGAVWRCLYKAELLKTVRFPVGIKLSEDRLFNMHAMGKARKLRYIKQAMYYRVVRPGSAVNRYHGDKFEKNLKVMKMAEEIINQYWDARYLPVYIRMFVIDGAWEAIYEVSGNEFPGKRRIQEIRKISDHPALAACFENCPQQTMRERLLAKGNAHMLFLMGRAVYLKRSLMNAKRRM